MTAPGPPGVNLGKHLLELLRPSIGEAVSPSADLEAIGDGATVTAVARHGRRRQRPETAKGITFMLIEDEFGTAKPDSSEGAVNVIVAETAVA